MRLSDLTSAGTLLFLVGSVYAKHGESSSSSSGSDDDDDDAVPTTSIAPTSSTATTSASATATSSAFQFMQPSNATTCASAQLRWTLSSSDPALSNATLSLAVSNDRALFPKSGSGPSATTSAPPASVSRDVTPADGVAAAAGAFTWAAVDVPAGTYVALAFSSSDNGSTDILGASPPFFVSAGNEGCLAASSSVGTSTGAGATQTGGADPNPKADNSAAPQKKLDPGVLGGVVAGVVIVVVLLILVFTFPHYWKERLVQRARSRRPVARNAVRSEWGRDPAVAARGCFDLRTGRAR